MQNSDSFIGLVIITYSESSYKRINSIYDNIYGINRIQFINMIGKNQYNNIWRSFIPTYTFYNLCLFRECSFVVPMHTTFL